MDDMEPIGWVALDENGSPVRPPRSGYRWHTNPARLYRTEGMAKAQSPVEQAAQVYMPIAHGA